MYCLIMLPHNPIHLFPGLDSLLLSLLYIPDHLSDLVLCLSELFLHLHPLNAHPLLLSL
jgi:hypothetical protein